MKNSDSCKPVIDLFELLDEVEDMLSERRALEGPAFDPFEGLDDQLDLSVHSRASAEALQREGDVRK